MQTSYSVNIRRAIKGLALCAPKFCRALELPILPQITRVSIAIGAGTSDVVFTVIDDKTGQTYTATATGSANEATLATNCLTALRAVPKLNGLFTFASAGLGDGNPVLIDFTARQSGPSYTISAVGGPSGASAAATVTATQAAGGSGLEFGQLVVRGSTDDSFAQLSSSSTVDQIAGMLYRTDGNHFHSRPELQTDVDLCVRGKHYDIAEEGEFWVQVAEAVTPASRVYVRVEGSNVGDWGDNPAGTAQTLTVTPIVNQAIYGFAFTATVDGTRHRIQAVYMPTDATTTIADACAGLFDAVTAEIAAKGLTSALTPTDNATTLTIAGASGILISEPSANVWYNDTEVATVTATVDAADVDMLDVSSICRYTSSASAGGLARVKLRKQP